MSAFDPLRTFGPICEAASMKCLLLTAAILLSAFPSETRSQPVPEGIHREAQGPSQMCGLTGANALDLIRQVTASPNFRRASGSNRFEFYLSTNGADALVFTLPSEPAYPAITCRHLFDQAGSTYQERTMRCDASREACDRLFLEFRALDEELARSLRR